MKIPRHRQKGGGADRVSLRDLITQPPPSFYKLPDFQLHGGYILTDGCRRVLDFGPDKISLDMGNFIVTFYGTELRIESLSGKRLILAGRLSSIVFQNKWEDAPHEK